MADVYRNPTADPAILSYYTRPLYVAVKLRDKVMPTGHAPAADIHLVNEENVRGGHDLTVSLIDPGGDTVWERSYRVTVQGGETFGQLLVENITLPAPERNGRYRVRAMLEKDGETVCGGGDELYAVDTAAELSAEALSSWAVIDDGGGIGGFLQETAGTEPAVYTPGPEHHAGIIVGRHDPADLRGEAYRDIMEETAGGATLVVLDNLDWWCGRWNDVFGYQAVDYGGMRTPGTGGRFAVAAHPLLAGLPQATAMNWEYQALYAGEVRGMDIGHTGFETVVALVTQNSDEILTSLAVIPYGNGRIIACTLDILDALSSTAPQTAPAKRLFANMLTTCQ